MVPGGHFKGAQQLLTPNHSIPTESTEVWGVAFQGLARRAVFLRGVPRTPRVM